MKTFLVLLFVLVGTTAKWHNEGINFSVDQWEGKIRMVENINVTGRDLVAHLDVAQRTKDRRLALAYIAEDCALLECDKTYERFCVIQLTDLPVHYTYTFKTESATENGEKIVIQVTVSSKYFDDPPVTYPMELTYDKKREKFVSVRLFSCNP